MTSILMVGDFPVLSAVEPAGRLRQTSTPGPRHDPSVLVSALEEELGAYRAVVVLYPTWSEPGLPRLLNRARNALGTDRMAVVGLDVSPLALAVLGAQAAAVANEASAGLAVAALPTLAAQLPTGAWLSSVSKLDAVPVTLLQHALSLWPPSRFAVTLPPRARVTPTRRLWPRLASRWVSASCDLVVVGAREDDRRLIEEHVLPAFGLSTATRTLTVEATALPGDARRWWRSRRVIEIVACPSNLSPLVDELRLSYPCAPCPWCGQEVLGPRCDFCDHLATRPLGGKPSRHRRVAAAARS